MASQTWTSLLVLTLRRQGHGNGWMVRGLLAAGALACFVFAFDQLDSAYAASPGPIVGFLRIVAILFVVSMPLAVITVLYLRLARALHETMRRGDDA